MNWPLSRFKTTRGLTKQTNRCGKFVFPSGKVYIVIRHKTGSKVVHT
jgi:dTDP-4-dehydrorhamnose 3,5-epimerase-like enzyme